MAFRDTFAVVGLAQGAVVGIAGSANTVQVANQPTPSSTARLSETAAGTYVLIAAPSSPQAVACFGWTLAVTGATAATTVSLTRSDTGAVIAGPLSTSTDGNASGDIGGTTLPAGVGVNLVITGTAPGTVTGTLSFSVVTLSLPRVVQHSYGTGSFAAFPVSPTAGNTLLAVVDYETTGSSGGGGTVLGLTEAMSKAGWTKVVDVPYVDYGNAGGVQLAAFVAEADGSSTPPAFSHQGGASWTNFHLYELADTNATAGGLPGQAQSGDTGGAGAATFGSATVPYPRMSVLILACGSYYGATTMAGTPGSWTYFENGGLAVGFCPENDVATVTATYTGSYDIYLSWITYVGYLN